MSPRRRIPQEMLLKKTCGLLKNTNILEHIVTELNGHWNQNMYAKVLNVSLYSILQTYLNSCLLFACSGSVCPWVVSQSTTNITWTYFNRLLLYPSFECNRNQIKLKGRAGRAGFCYHHLASHTLLRILASPPSTALLWRAPSAWACHHFANQCQVRTTLPKQKEGSVGF